MKATRVRINDLYFFMTVITNGYEEMPIISVHNRAALDQPLAAMPKYYAGFSQTPVVGQSIQIHFMEDGIIEGVNDHVLVGIVTETEEVEIPT